MNDTLTGVIFALLALALGLALALTPRGLDPAHREPIALVTATTLAFLLAGAFPLTIGGVSLVVIDTTALTACIGARIGRRPLIRWATEHPTRRGARFLLAIRDATSLDPYRRLLEPLGPLAARAGCRPTLTLTAGDWTTIALRCDHGTYPGRDPDGRNLIAATGPAVAAWRLAHTNQSDAFPTTTAGERV
jgi:hypothetical protein